ncbi:hypothetical protein [Bifidobacterium samirii]|uniref:PhnA protein n=1 Tax=Bifidobacterium samirii TaxID=2306974 RepID=A0A430FUE6_9BIFI|nr:hypothetical protein [Bifidobacterium samirii]RSX56758.1 hypothetical protein D2E24_1048 [Bifidobacterium samirii]
MFDTSSEETYRRDLASLRAGYDALDQIARKQAHVTATTTGPAGRTTAPVPLNLGAWQLQQDIVALIDNTARAARIPRRGLTVEQQIGFILHRLPALAEREDMPLIADLTHQAATRLDQLLDPPPETKMIGHCPTCGIELRCDQQEIDGGYTECDHCHTTHRIKDIHQATITRLAISGAQGTPASIERLLRPWGIAINRRTISKWGTRGHIHPTNHTPNGDPIYLIWDVWQCLNRNTTTRT